MQTSTGKNRLFVFGFLALLLFSGRDAFPQEEKGMLQLPAKKNTERTPLENLVEK